MRLSQYSPLLFPFGRLFTDAVVCHHIFWDSYGLLRKVSNGNNTSLEQTNLFPSSLNSDPMGCHWISTRSYKERRIRNMATNPGASDKTLSSSTKYKMYILSAGSAK